MNRVKNSVLYNDRTNHPPLAFFFFTTQHQTTKQKKRKKKINKGPGLHTSVVLLLLVVVAELSFALRRHPALRLEHLVRLGRTALEALRRVVPLQTSGGVHPSRIKIAHRVMALRRDPT